MDAVRLGIRYRALRQRLGLRQQDLADRCARSQTVISKIERGRASQVLLGNLIRVASELDADLVVTLRWRGGDLDRLVDERHAQLVGTVVELLRPLGWDLRPEVSYSVYGERGSIDLLAWHSGLRALLVIEVKTELVSIEETLRKHDEKTRLAPGIAIERFGWRASAVARLLVLPSAATPRRQVERHARVLGSTYAARGLAIRRWLREPIGALAGILFVDVGRERLGAHGRRRVRRPPE